MNVRLKNVAYNSNQELVTKLNELFLTGYITMMHTILRCSASISSSGPILNLSNIIQYALEVYCKAQAQVTTDVWYHLHVGCSHGKDC